MKKEKIKSHLAIYSISRKRKTTVNHAFASAIAPVDLYDPVRLAEALRLLGQDPNGELTCVYCGTPAQTWDHLIGLVKQAELRGYGHQLGNLVPCCGTCNSQKGAKDWVTHLQGVVPEQTAFESRRAQIAAYLDRYAIPVNLERAAKELPQRWKRYCEIKQQILQLMVEADTVADELRNVVTSRNA